MRLIVNAFIISKINLKDFFGERSFTIKPFTRHLPHGKFYTPISEIKALLIMSG